MINLFEYQNKEFLGDSFHELEAFLDVIWNKRERYSFYNDDQLKSESQRFIQFLHNTKEIKSNKYVGVINYKGQTINLLPKIFFDPNTGMDTNDHNVGDSSTIALDSAGPAVLPRL